MKSVLYITAMSLCLGHPAFANDKEQRSTLKDQTSIAVTIYNKNLALIKDQRKITLDSGLYP